MDSELQDLAKEYATRGEIAHERCALLEHLQERHLAIPEVRNFTVVLQQEDRPEVPHA